jgi:uncharacterized membrane protein (UPF0136 family)
MPVKEGAWAGARWRQQKIFCIFFCFLYCSLQHKKRREREREKERSEGIATLPILHYFIAIATTLRYLFDDLSNMANTPGSAHLNFTMGGLVALGGAFGYMRKGSTMSLLAGATFGGLLIGSGVLITQGESFQGHALASGCTGIMTLAMGQRFLSTGKFMPAGMVASVGAIGLAYNVKKAIEWMPDKSGKQL